MHFRLRGSRVRNPKFQGIVKCTSVEKKAIPLLVIYCKSPMVSMVSVLDVLDCHNVTVEVVPSVPSVH